MPPRAAVNPSDIPTLVQRLRSGRRAAQLQAANVLAEQVIEDPAAAAAVVAAGAVPILTRLLGGGSVALQCAAANALANTLASSGQPAHFAAFMEAGGVQQLTECLSDSGASDQLLKSAVALLGNVMSQHNSRRLEAGSALAAGGAATALARVLGGNQPASTQRVACTALANFTSSLERAAKDSLVAAGVVHLLARHAHAGDPECLAQAATALSNMVDGGAECAAAVAAEDMIPLYLRLLPDSTQQARQIALVGLYNLSAFAEQRGAIAAAGGIQTLTHCLAAWAPEDAAGLAAAVLARVVANSPERCHAAVEAGAVSALEQLKGGCAAVDQDVSHALHTLTTGLQRAPQPLPSSQPRPPAHRPPAARICAAPGCGATSGLKRCGGCGKVRYCSEACSRAHWREHRAECRRLQTEQAAAGQQQQQP